MRRPSVAVAFAYSQEIKYAGEALERGLSVLVRGSPNIADDFVRVLAIEMHRHYAEDFLSAKLNEERRNSVVIQRGDRAIQNPSSQLLLEFHLKLIQASEGKNIITCVLDFLDLFATVTGSQQSDLLYLLYEHKYKNIPFLGFCSTELSLPPLIRDRFTVHLTLPRLRRETVWAMLNADQMSNLFGTNPLTVAHQVALYHAVAGVDALHFQQLVESERNAQKGPTEPFSVISEIKNKVVELRRPSVFTKPQDSDIISQLRQYVIDPIKKYRYVTTSDEVDALDLQIRHSILLTNISAKRNASIAHWLADELDATLLVLNGTSLSESPLLFRRARKTYPSVLCIQDMELGLLGGGEPLRAFVTEWQTVDIGEPLIVCASVQESNALPRSVRSRFQLILDGSH
jgi:hypothetical protein